jgi:hypothetical protein
MTMKCDFRASFSTRTFASPCFGRKPKVKVMTTKPIFSSHVSIIMGVLGLDVGNSFLMLEVATCNCQIWEHP